MKNMLVTGGCGFIGSNFIRHMLSATDFDGCIINADNLTYAGNPDNLSDLETNERYYFEKADICDKSEMAGIFDRYEINTVCHFAAESHVDRSIEGPGDFVNTNIFSSLKKFSVNFSSDWFKPFLRRFFLALLSQIFWFFV